MSTDQPSQPDETGDRNSSGEEAASGAETASKPPTETLGDGIRHYGEHRRERARTAKAKRDELRVREAIDYANQEVVAGEYQDAALICRDILVPILDVGRANLQTYHDYLASSDLGWDFDAVSRFIDDPERFVAAAADIDRSTDPESQIADARLRLQGYRPERVIVRETIEHAVISLESVAVLRGIVPGELTQSSDVVGHELQVGLQWQPWDYESPDKVQVVSPDIHPPFTLSIGRPGNGKSTAVDTIVEDEYAAGHKVIDLLDTDELENAMYDVPSRQNVLRHKREQLGLPPDFEAADHYDAPDVEILHPLCDRLCDAKLPYDTEREEFVARPFVIPVADLDATVLKTLMRNVTDAQENYLDEALDALGDESDWSLDDLRREIDHTTADQGTKARLIAGVRKLQNRGWLATRDHPYAIDWPDIFEDTDTITAFSTSMIDDETHKKMVLVYLVDALLRERDPNPPGTEQSAAEVSQYPRALAVFREMQEVAPSDGLIGDASNATSRLDSTLIDRMQTLSMKRRHTDLGILGDTQQWVQINKRVRANIDRVLMFNLPAGIARSIFSKQTGSNQQSNAKKVQGFKPGECAVIGDQWLSTGRSYEMPLEWAPPMCHHLDAEEDPDGWRARVQYRDAEEFRDSPYSLDGTGVSRVTEWAEAPEVRDSPEAFTEFVEEALEYDRDPETRIPKTAVREAYVEFADRNGAERPKASHQIGRWLREFYPEEVVEVGKMRVAGGRVNAYICLTLTEYGDELAEEGPDNPF